MNNKSTSHRSPRIVQSLVSEELGRQGFYTKLKLGTIIASSKDSKNTARIRVRSSFTAQDDYYFLQDITDLIKEMNKENSDIFYIFVVIKDKPIYFIFKAQEIYNVMEKRITACVNKKKTVSGPWEMRLSDLVSSNNDRKENDWSCLKEYLSQN